LEDELKSIILSELKIKDVAPSDFGDDEPLFGGRLGLDSLDAIEIIMIVKKHFGIEIKNRNEARKYLESVRTLAEFIRLRQAT
jgi:acyl carrier protein